jgi:uncharacterized protein (DUF885 family)
MKKIIGFLVVSLCFFGCNSNKDTEFDTFKNNFVKNLWQQFPEWASSQGYHKFDDVLLVPNNETRKNQLEFTNKYNDSLMNFDLESLSDNNKTDFYLIKNQLESFTFATNELKSYEWNPSEYNVCGGFAEMLNSNYKTLEKRLQNINKRLLVVPQFYEAAKANIKNPTSEHTQLAIDQNLGGNSVFETDIVLAVEKSKLSQTEKDDILKNAKIAAEAVKNYADFLKKLNNSTPTDFRLGKDLYERKFNFDIQSGYTVDEIFKKATTHKTELHQKMFELSEKLWTKYLPETQKPTDKLLQIKMIIDKISEQHTTPENFQTEIDKQIPELVAFVKQKNLLFIDPKKPLVVRKEPDYMAGVAGASISAPGPYDKNGNTYYNVGSMAGWTKERSESYLREYNDYILQILNIHEAIPGHYTQLVYSNQSPSLIKSIFGNGAMIEGWAVYTEKMMLESGYKNSDEMWLMYYKWNLRSTCNTILDISVHTKNMTKEQAIDLLVNQAFQQQAEADGKWKRVTLTQVQLCSYFTGFTEIYDFCESLKKQQGKDFNLKAFHEKFLSYGSAPVKYIKELYSQN